MKQELLYKEWLTIWQERKRGYVRESTLENYNTAIMTHILPVLGEVPVSGMMEQCLQETALFWLQSGRCDGGGGLSERTVRNLVTIVKLTLKEAAKEGYLPMRRYEIRYPRTEPRICFDKVNTLQTAEVDITDNAVTAAHCADATYHGTYPKAATVDNNDACDLAYAKS